MNFADPNIAPDPDRVLGKAVLRAGERMGLSRTEIGRILGRDRSSISRAGVDPDSKSGELATILIRCYRSLAVMVDDNPQQIREWLAVAFGGKFAEEGPCRLRQTRAAGQEFVETL